jgi:hypothetical protein
VLERLALIANDQSDYVIVGRSTTVEDNRLDPGLPRLQSAASALGSYLLRWA